MKTSPAFGFARGGLSFSFPTHQQPQIAAFAWTEHHLTVVSRRSSRCYPTLCVSVIPNTLSLYHLSLFQHSSISSDCYRTLFRTTLLYLTLLSSAQPLHAPAIPRIIVTHPLPIQRTPQPASTMPTPDETACPPSPPTDIPARSSYPSCPPEEERDACDDEGEEAVAEAEGDDHAIAQEPTPEPDVIEGASPDREEQSKTEDTATDLNTPTSVASPDAVAPDGDIRAQASSSSNPDAPIPFPSQYLDFAPNKERVCIRSLQS